MNRRKFLRMLGVGAVSVPVVAKALPEIIKTPLEATKVAERDFGLTPIKAEGQTIAYDQQEVVRCIAGEQIYQGDIVVINGVGRVVRATISSSESFLGVATATCPKSSYVEVVQW